MTVVKIVVPFVEIVGLDFPPRITSFLDFVLFTLSSSLLDLVATEEDSFIYLFTRWNIHEAFTQWNYCIAPLFMGH